MYTSTDAGCRLVGEVQWLHDELLLAKLAGKRERRGDSGIEGRGKRLQEVGTLLE